VSTLKVEVVAIDAILPHPNADRLELAQVKGWQCVVGKGAFKAGDVAIYFPVDSLLPADLEAKLFPPTSKIKLTKSRIRSIKIRSVMSQGMLVEGDAVDMPYIILGQDLTETLGVKKWEPPEPEYQVQKNPKTGGKSQINPNFRKYTDIENIKNFPYTFQDGELVYISEKLHGTSSRYGYVPRWYKPTLLGRIRKTWDGIINSISGTTPFDYVYGSRNVQLQTGERSPWYKEDVYAKIGVDMNFEEILRPGECVYGEIVGHNIQKNYTYGCKEGEHKFFAYDVMVDGKWLDPIRFTAFCDARGIPRVPELYMGPYSKEIELQHRDGDSTVGGQKIREGVVIKPLVETRPVENGRTVLKSISDAYYLEDNSEWH
jgi:RNA ligase (TIGR02306 family)